LAHQLKAGIIIDFPGVSGTWSCMATSNIGHIVIYIMALADLPGSNKGIPQTANASAYHTICPQFGG
jgi:hypothetical protein